MPGEQTTKQNVQTEPWGPVQPALKDYLSKITGFFNGGSSGGNPNLSGFGGGPESGIPGAGGGGGSGSSIFSPTQSPWTTDAYNMIAGMAKGGSPLIDAAGGTLTSLMGKAGQPGSAATNLADYASGKYINGGSPEFLAALDSQSQKTADDIARQYSASGRYGGAGMANTIGSTIADSRNRAIADEQARQQGLQFSANSLISGEDLSRMGLGLNAANSAPGLDAARYNGANQLAKVGALQDQFNWQKQIAPWTELQAQGGLLSQLAGLGGSQNSSVTQPYNPLMALLGGGIGLGNLLFG